MPKNPRPQAAKPTNGRDLLVSILSSVDTLQHASDDLLNENINALTQANDSLDYILSQFAEEADE